MRTAEIITAYWRAHRAMKAAKEASLRAFWAGDFQEAIRQRGRHRQWKRTKSIWLEALNQVGK